ncbi:hypothetical protein [Mycobacterium asiaticum]|uniref:hypothetical protein n=1 Tax=Mycobacterium asiaticum TaxID=1790 RepID=UPI0012DB7525|nr:hypothetical protein [Mycobacterium asiaticum]
MGELTAEEFTRLVLLAAAPPDRVAEVVARLVGDQIAIGPLAAGPGKIASATALGTRGAVGVAVCEDDYWRQIVTVPIALRVKVQLAKQIFRYRGKVEVQIRFRLRLDPPCTVTVELEEVQKHHIRTAVDPGGVGARVIGWVGGVEETVAEQVLSYVKDLMSSPSFDAAMHIDVPGLLRRAWDADLVVQVAQPGLQQAETVRPGDPSPSDLPVDNSTITQVPGETVPPTGTSGSPDRSRRLH